MTVPAGTTHSWIIGASHGIGQALAYELAQRKETLTLSARSQKALTDVATTLPKASPQAPHDVLPLDVANPQDLQNAITKLRQPIHRIIFMAGIYTPMPLAKLDIKECHAIIDVNLCGALHLLHAVLPMLLQQRTTHPTIKSQIALCASVAGYIGLPHAQPYAASKAALINLAESLLFEHGRHIDVKVINTGFVETRLTDKNTFTMPMKLSPQQAARTIARGLNTRAFEITTPKLFTTALKLLALLPKRWSRTLMTRRTQP
ncbi:MAG: SDR family NAD(P)-dependent oxidoreductase [Alphaproteobacteria bacterium GM202ARS2]|nr:SDR family NAD(P)-dependent oxidoreductase [Alphaproteobacteria bacterium GM202ARS2]